MQAKVGSPTHHLPIKREDSRLGDIILHFELEIFERKGGQLEWSLLFYKALLAAFRNSGPIV